MTIARWTFVTGATLVACVPALECLPGAFSPPAEKANHTVFMIDGWSVTNNGADEVWIRVGR